MNTTTNETRIHVTISEDGWGETPSDEDRASFCAYVEERVEAMHPGSVCTTEIANVLRTTVTAPTSVDAGELAAIVGNEIWEEWCSGERASG